MNISAPFIQRPVGTSLLTLAACCWRERWRFDFLPVAPLPQVDFPTIQVSAGLAGRESGDDGLGGRDAAGAAVWAHRRRQPDDVVEPAWARPASRCSSI